MSFTYCQLCGHKNLYSMDPPKFCGECGEPLTKKGGPSKPSPRNVKVSNSSARKRQPPSQGGEPNDEEGSDIYEVPEIGDFKCSVSSEGLGNRRMNLGDLLPPQEEIVTKRPLDEAPKKRKRRRRAKK
jgi:hypothetical protein